VAWSKGNDIHQLTKNLGLLIKVSRHEGRWENEMLDKEQVKWQEEDQTEKQGRGNNHTRESSISSRRKSNIVE
jgi:hypothetical protein